MSTLSTFKGLFRFSPASAWQIGCEREFFLTEGTDRIVPKAPLVIRDVRIREGGPSTWDEKRFEPIDPHGQIGFELSAAQIEARTLPVGLDKFLSELDRTQSILHRAVHTHSLRALCMEVGPANMPRDIYPDPRYADIAKKLPEERLLAALRITGTHFHIGMPDHETALIVHNNLAKRWREYASMGDGSNGERLRLYALVAPGYVPRQYRSWEHFHEVARKDGFEDDPRRNWEGVRMTVHGTVEVRFCGAARDSQLCNQWGRRIHADARAAVPVRALP